MSRWPERPLEPPPLTPALRALLATSKLNRPNRPLKVFDALLHHPRAMRSLRGFLEWGEDAVLSPRERELTILRTVRLARCSQGWSVHSVIATYEYLVTQEEVERIEGDADPSEWPAREATRLMMADALSTADTLDDSQWREASLQLSSAEIIETLLVVGYYRMVSGLQNALGVPAEEDFSLP